MSKPHLKTNPVKQRLALDVTKRNQIGDLAVILQLVASAGYTEEVRHAASSCKQLRGEEQELWTAILRTSIDVPQRSPLFHAMVTRNETRFRWLCDRVFHPLTMVDAGQLSLIRYAMRYDMPPSILNFLIDKGALVDQVDARGQPPLFSAITNQNLPWIKALVQYGASVNYRCRETMTPLYVAMLKGNLPIVQFLCDKGADVTEEAVVVRAVRYGHLDVLQELLERGASLNATDPNGHSLLHYAVRFNHPTLCLYLLEFLEVDCVSRNQVTPLMLAPTLAIWTLLGGSRINHSDINGWTALHYAVHHRRPEIVSALLASGANKNRLTHSGMTPLDLATVKDYQELVTLLEA